MLTSSRGMLAHPEWEDAWYFHQSCPEYDSQCPSSRQHQSCSSPVLEWQPWLSWCRKSLPTYSCVQCRRRYLEQSTRGSSASSRSVLRHGAVLVGILWYWCVCREYRRDNWKHEHFNAWKKPDRILTHLHPAPATCVSDPDTNSTESVSPTTVTSCSAKGLFGSFLFK